MILAVDMGNTNILVGGIDEKKIYFQERLSTSEHRTSFEYAELLRNMLQMNNVDIEEIDGAILASVVPDKNSHLISGIKKATGLDCKVVNADMKLDFEMTVDNKAEIGADLIVSTAAVVENYHLPAAMIDMGTATTVFIVDENKKFIGGVIHPGVEVSLKTLSSSASLLPGIDFKEVTSVIGHNTRDCMRSGVLYGHAGIIDSILIRMENELGTPLTAIATGGFSRFIAPLCGHPVVVDVNLILKGLLKIYKDN